MARHYDDDYEGSSFEKFTHRKSKSHKKGHQSRSANHQQRWDQVINDMEVEDNPTETFPGSGGVHIVPQFIPPKSEYKYGSNTREIKGVKIDFDGVADIQKIENIQNNVTTYGIKFIFKGKKGLYRIVWFNTNMRGRDAAYNSEYGFWLTLNKR